MSTYNIGESFDPANNVPVQKVFTYQFCCKITVVNAFVRGVLGRCYIYTLRYIKVIKYWLKILQMNTNQYLS